MKRSEIERLIDEAIALLKEHRFALPPFAYWTAAEWKGKGPECDEIRDNMLGWDLTDFGSGDFLKTGLLLFTIRNGSLCDPKYPKPYSEKIMVVREDQVTPFHFHWKKMEDIINRGGGNLVVQFYNSTKDGARDKSSPVLVSVDACKRTLPAGGKLVLKTGESVTMSQGLYHAFWAEGGAGTALVGEVSKVNDDNTDNRFLGEVGRFPPVDEDIPRRHVLCNEYGKI